jgi:hypothetical protein
MTVPDDLRRLADAELSLPPRLGYVALLLLALSMTALVTALWVTEPALPARVQVAFATMILIGISWVTFASWVLTHRRTLLARHGVVAGWMAVVFTSVFLVGALGVGVTKGGSAPYAAAAMGGVLLAGAMGMLVRARRVFARLTERRDALQREIGGSAR